ncbi:nucleoside deaminase [Kistimonas scapharcae]|uniref:Nucleoside deaminase n=1 Tax=Kistimonas scapharcae TaxID=1036133 RepID=A0ABP8V9A2_9GAMM
MTSQTFSLALPAWAEREHSLLPEYLPSLEERMSAVIRFSRLNIEHNTGGPFAAGVFERNSGRRMIIGVNRVMDSHCSSAHAEVMALSLAQKALGQWDLGSAGLPAYQLVVNWRPCVMCYGAVLWSGIRSLVVAGSGPELEQITGFDEGPIHPDWKGEFKKRGIDVTDNILTNEAIAVFRQFRDEGHVVYNARQGEPA